MHFRFSCTHQGLDEGDIHTSSAAVAYLLNMFICQYYTQQFLLLHVKPFVIAEKQRPIEVHCSRLGKAFKAAAGNSVVTVSPLCCLMGKRRKG